jgi:hypothetical protein
MRELEGGDVGTLSILGRDWQNYSDEAVVDQAGNYAVHLPFSTTGTNTVTLNISNGQFICSCPLGCSYGGITAPMTGLNFYVTDAQHPWFQVSGGSIIAHQATGVAIKNPISTLCGGPTEEAEGEAGIGQSTCRPYMIAKSAGDNTSGYVLTGGGDVDLRIENGVQNTGIDEDGSDRLGKVNSRAAQERYEYFARLYKLPVNPQNDFDTGEGAQEPTGTPINSGVEAYYYEGDMTLNDPWTIEANESRVIFVEGNLRLNNTITVASGGFLAFIVSEDITIDPSVGYDDVTQTTPLIEGVFVANGLLELPGVGTAAGGDRKFVGAGTFVGWGGIALERDYDNGQLRRRLNNYNSTELFIYRPDLALNAPTQMQTPRYQWREVSP